MSDQKYVPLDEEQQQNQRHIIEDLKAEITRLNNALKDKERKDKRLEEIYSIGPLKMAYYRAPALLITLTIELIGGLLVYMMNDVVKKYVLLVSFVPAVSALSGNLGLQATSNTIRGLGTGHIGETDILKTIKKEIKSSIILSIMIGSIIGIVGIISSFHGKDSKEFIKKHQYHPYLFGTVLFAGACISMMASSINGVFTPMIANKCKLDPAKVSGPLGTTLQDIIGQTFLYGVSYAVFEYVEPLLN